MLLCGLDVRYSQHLLLKIMNTLTLIFHFGSNFVICFLVLQSAVHHPDRQNKIQQLLKSLPPSRAEKEQAERSTEGTMEEIYCICRSSDCSRFMMYVFFFFIQLSFFFNDIFLDIRAFFYFILLVMIKFLPHANIFLPCPHTPPSNLKGYIYSNP